MTTNKSKSADRIIAAMIAGLSKEGIDRQILHEYRQGYPLASDAQIQMLVDAEAKAGGVPRNLDHAKKILSDNIYAFVPRHGSPFDRSGNLWRAFRYWVP